MKIIATAIAIIGMAAIGVTSPRVQQQDKPSHSVWEGVYTKEQAKRGEGLYANNCSSCHGPDLSGNDEAAPLTGAAFLANWDGLTVGDLSERVRRSMPPNKLGQLSRQQIADILGYVLSFNNFPPGNAALDPKPEVQKQVRIEAIKPK
jgi:cytochrome c